MSDLEMRRLFSGGKDGFRLSPSLSLKAGLTYQNQAIFAPTGGGKTSRFVIPNILERSGSFVVTDPSGEIFHKTSGAMQQRGYRIEVFRPSEPQNSAQYNPLHRRRDLHEIRELARGLANRVSSAKDPYWSIASITPLYVFAAALKHAPDQACANLANLRWLLTKCGVTGRSVEEFMAANLPDDALFAEYEAFMSQDARTISSHLSTALAALDAWADPSIAEATAGDSIGIERLRAEPTIIYVIVPEQKIDHYATLMNLFYADCFRHCYAAPDGLPVHFLLDEFGNLGRVERFKETITTLRKYRCSITLILQDEAQIRAAYGEHEAEAILNGGVVTKIYLPGLGLRACQELERQLGQRTVYDTLFGGVDDHARTLAKPLLHLDEIRMLDPDSAILLTGREKPARIKTEPYFRNGRLVRMTKQAAAELEGGNQAPLRYIELQNAADFDATPKNRV